MVMKSNDPEFLREVTEIANAPLRPEDDVLLDHAPSKHILEGEKYNDAVPDTLDLAERLRLAIIPATNRYYPDDRWHMGFLVFAMRPFALFKTLSECGWLSIAPKVIEALIYCRRASGSGLNIEIDRKILATQLGLLGDDGLTYSPLPPADGKSHPEYEDHLGQACLWNEGRWLQTLSLLTQADESDIWMDLAKRKVDRLLELSRSEDGFRYFYARFFMPGQSFDQIMTEEAVSDNDPSSKTSHNYHRADAIGAVCHGAIQVYRQSGYGPALELCRGMVSWAMKKIYVRDDGIYLVQHFYHGVYPLIGMAIYAGITGDKEVLRRVDACYRWARDMGEPLVGFYSNEMPGSKGYLEKHQQYMEICALSNMVLAALQLSRYGAGDYWDDIERWTRNTYAHSQMTDLSVLDLPDDLFDPAAEKGTYNNGMQTRSMEARSIGSFFTTITGNDIGIMKDDKFFGAIASCCITNGPRALYCVWDSIVEGDEKNVRINLLLNRASEWVDIYSYIPAEGRVTVRVKKTRNIEIRIPGWVNIDNVEAGLNGEHIETDIAGRYVRVCNVRNDDVIDIIFPMPEEKTVNRIIGRHPYRLTIKGSNVVKIDPPGIVQPFYTKQSEGKLIQKERFVSNIRLIW
jgi:hypothetical protein